MPEKKKSNRTYVPLSFSIPPELEGPMNAAAADSRFTSRSEYLAELVRADLVRRGLVDANAVPRLAPVRVRRRSAPKKKPGGGAPPAATAS